jgi:hypothetical protein
MVLFIVKSSGGNNESYISYRLPFSLHGRSFSCTTAGEVQFELSIVTVAHVLEVQYHYILLHFMNGYTAHASLS